MSERTTSTPPNASGLSTFWLDVKYTRIASAFAGAGVETILLKGPAFDQLLFDGARARAYSDIDLLVDPARAVAAERLLEQLGFRRSEQQSVVRRLGRRAGMAVGVLRAEHATAWVRERDKFTVDAHHTLPEGGASAEETWRALRTHRDMIALAGTSVQTLDATASALLIALHAAHHGPGWRRARADLERACEVLDPDCWHAAARLARELRAEAAMGFGLGTTEQGRAIARELGLRTEPTAALRLRWLGVAWAERGRLGLLPPTWRGHRN